MSRARAPPRRSISRISRSASQSGSTYQRWFFFWEPNGTLWVHSSDIGGCAWTLEGGTWTQHPLIKDGPLVARMPAEVRESLPPTLRKEMGL